MHTRLVIIAIAGALSACAVGPDFQIPPAPSAHGYLPGVPPGGVADVGADGLAQRFPADLPATARWWESFGSVELNELVATALARSPTSQQARARLRQAEEDLRAVVRSTRFPAVDAQLGVTRQKLNPAALGIPNAPQEPPFTVFSAQLNVSYRLDVFGGNRRASEAARAQVDYAREEADAIRLTLAANVVVAAIRAAELSAELALLEQLLAAQARQVAVAESRFAAGGISDDQLQGIRRQYEQQRAQLPALRQQRQQVDHQLAVYSGVAPSEARPTSLRLADLHLPDTVPVGLPSDLVRRRPDVRAAEAQWHQASANVGIATANLFPRLTLTASGGSQRTDASELADSANVWSLGAGLLQPIFHAGELRARRRSAVAAYDAAAESYQQTVLESLQQVADGLRALEADARALDARTLASREAARSRDIARERFSAGGISESVMLDSERQSLQSEQDRSRAEAQRLTDTAALMHALAGPV